MSRFLVETCDVQQISNRMKIRDATKKNHQLLHVHPMFSRLVSEDLLASELHTVGLTKLSVFMQVESARFEAKVWPELNFRSQVTALFTDTFDARKVYVPRLNTPLNFKSTYALLGGLYVAHGSAFGANVMAKTIKKSLPDAAISYYCFQSPRQWSQLCKTLETLRECQLEQAISGANLVFNTLLEATPTSLLGHGPKTATSTSCVADPPNISL